MSLILAPEPLVPDHLEPVRARLRLGAAGVEWSTEASTVGAPPPPTFGVQATVCSPPAPVFSP